jgi:cytochrome c peroxidase
MGAKWPSIPSKLLAAWLGLTIAACGSGDGGPAAGAGAGGAGGGSGAGGDGPVDPDPVFTPEERAALEKLSPAELPPPPIDVSNAKADDPAAAALGQRFFFTPVFAGRLLDGDNNGGPGTLGNKGDTGKVSCASCHLPNDDFNDTRSPSKQISLGSGWGARKAPSLLDVGQTKMVMWDGSHDALYNQVFGPIESPLEMNSSRLYVAQRIFELFKDEYEAVFGPLPPLDDTARFPPLSATETGCTPAGQEAYAVCDGAVHGAPGDGAEFDGLLPGDKDDVTRVVVNMGKAVGAYERLLTCGPGRFDAWMHGDESALSRAEQRGAAIFVGKGKCVSCHDGPFLSDQRFHVVGMVPAQVASAFIDADDHGASEGLPKAIASPLNTKGPFSDGDDGRLPSEVLPSHEGAFRTPTLRCVARRPSFMHTGQMKTLDDVVAFFDQGGHPGLYFGTKEVTALSLTELERSDLVAFLKALDGPGAPGELTRAP